MRSRILLIAQHLAVVFALCCFLLPVQADQGMSLRQIAELQQVGQVVIHPDGDRVAYTKSVPRTLFEQDDGPAWSELHVVDAQGNSRGYITGQVNISAVQFTPDGEHIAFLTSRSGDDHRSLYRIALAGGEAQRWFKPEAAIRAYSFSPDGKQVAYLAMEAEDPELESLREKGFSQVIYEEDWRPVRVYVQSLEDTSAEPRKLEIEGSVQSVHWSPVDDRLAVTVAPREMIDDVIMRTRIRVVSSEDGSELARVENPGKLGQIAWSPDAEHIALLGVTDISDPREGRLQVVSSSGGEIRDLLPGLEGHVWHVDWRGDRILFISYEGVEARVAEINRDGSDQQTLLEMGGPIWGSLSVADNGRIAVGADTPRHPREAWLTDASGQNPERLTNSNPWLDDVELARQEVVRYQARDGLEIEGLLVRPLNEREGQRYPLILAVHGGPEAHYSNGWLSGYSLPAQPAAARGFAMFFPNYRASTGRGVEFSKLNHGRPAAEEFDDLVDGVDHLIETGLVDRDRVGITGGSYGGYASAWGATYYSERFAASVMFVGLSDKISMLGTSDIPTELYHVHYLSWPWEDWDMYRQASPIYHSHKGQTPILILHGDADPRVDRSQSMSLYRYLKLQGNAPVRLVLYPGEGHGNSRAASRWDYSLRMMRWMEHYLTGEGGDPPPHTLDYGQPEDD